jgi:AraC-like DNA-binding protein
MAAMVRAAALSNFVEVSRQFSIDPVKLIRKARLDPVVLTNPDIRIPALSVALMLEAAAEQSGCVTFGLRMAESRRLSDFGALSLLLSHEPTLRQTLSTLERYRHLLNESLAIYVEESDETVVIREELITEKGVITLRQATELAVGTMFRLYRAVLGGRWHPDSVEFVHSAPSDLTVHRRVFSTKVRFGSEFNGIVCARSDLDRSNPAADTTMAQYAQRFVESLNTGPNSTKAMEVRKAIYLLLPTGRASIEQIADSMGVNVRTLQRQLDAEEAVFSVLLNDVRRDLVMRYLASPGYSLTLIAEMLGYSQLSSFTRWFAGQFDMAPTTWRAKVSGDGLRIRQMS